MPNVDADVVAGFGDEWSRFNQEKRSLDDLRQTFDRYFATFPWDRVSSSSTGFDLGCGSGRWAQFVAGRCASLVCIDPSADALNVARHTLRAHSNVRLVEAGAGALPFASGTFDFGYSLGVLHHTPDPEAGLRDAVRILKPGAPLLLYLYYALDNRPVWFRAVWRGTDRVRRFVSRQPHRRRYAASQALAATVYWPLARTARLVEKAGSDPERVPLAAYRDKPFYVMRTDALDRFGTRIEFRYTRDEMVDLMQRCGLEGVVVGEGAPYWCAVGFRSATTAS